MRESERALFEKVSACESAKAESPRSLHSLEGALPLLAFQPRLVLDRRNMCGQEIRQAARNRQEDKEAGEEAPDGLWELLVDVSNSVTRALDSFR